jgi:hypothetical protein
VRLLSPVLELGRHWASSHPIVAGEVWCPRRGAMIDVERCMRCSSLRDIVVNDDLGGDIRCWPAATDRVSP